ncbi:MAG TPA: phage holin family protein [Bryobacteraceae bacterium]|jgi:putative membrane protein|nr:phage holin family protein [Bryobacteraceae bacterium]
MAYYYLWPEIFMLVHIILVWLVSALALWLVAQIVPGIEVRDFGAALLATIVIAIVNAIVGPVLRFFAWPLTILTLGLFKLIVNAILLKLASMFSPGFRVRGFLDAIIGALLLTVLESVLRFVVL